MSSPGNTTAANPCGNDTTPLPDTSAAQQIIADAMAQPSADQEASSKLVDELRAFRMSVADQYPPEVYLLENDGVGFFAKGDIHAIKAKQKNGKTNAIAIMVAAILGGDWGPLRSALPMAKVLVIDTEQKAADVQLVYNRTIKLAKLPLEDYYDRFQTYSLRSLTAEQKLKAVEVLIRDFQPDIVFIDGVVDLMGNFNEVEESKAIIEHLMRLTTPEVSGAEVAIVCVLHTNKSSDDHNMRGHAGTMLAQKSGTVLEVKKDDGIFTITNTDARHKEVPRWSYTYDIYDNIINADQIRAEKAEEARQNREELRQQKQEDTMRQRIEIVVKIIQQNGGQISRPELSRKMQEEMKIVRQTAERIMKQFISQGIITLSPDRQTIELNKEHPKT